MLWERKHQVNHIFLSNLKLLWQCVSDATMLIYALRTIANVKLQNKTTDFILLTMFDQSKKVWTQNMTFILKHFHHINVFPSHQIIKEEFTLRKNRFFFLFFVFHNKYLILKSFCVTGKRILIYVIKSCFLKKILSLCL